MNEINMIENLNNRANELKNRCNDYEMREDLLRKDIKELEEKLSIAVEALEDAINTIEKHYGDGLMTHVEMNFTWKEKAKEALEKIKR